MEEALLEIGSDDEVTVDGESLDVADVLRAQPTPDNCGVEVTTCARQSGWCATRARVLRTRTLRVRDGAATARHLTQLVKCLSPDAPHKVLVVVNPAGGTGRAQKVFERDVAPVFYAANIEADVVVTKAQGDAMERCRLVAAAPQVTYDGVVVVGGDGTLSEVVRGLADGASTLADPEQRLRSIRVAHCPGGTGNACHASVASAGGDVIGSAVDVAYNVARGFSCSMGLVRYEFGERRPPFISFLAMEWGLVADVDLGSEGFRWLGALRTTLAAIWYILRLKRHRATLSWLPCTQPARKGGLFAASQLPPLGAPLPPPWRTERRDATYQLMMACNVSHVDETTPMAPAAGLDDGAIHLVFTRLRPGFLARVDLIDGFLKLDGGKHIHKRSFQSHRCRALRLVPAADDDSRTGLDGEAVPSGAIQAEIFPGALRVFCAAPLAAARTAVSPPERAA